MCGIIGYVGSDEVVPVLLDGLRRLEYRGYDSAGIAVAEDGRLTTLPAYPGVLELIEAGLGDDAFQVGEGYGGHAEPEEQDTAATEDTQAVSSTEQDVPAVELPGIRH